MGCVGAPPSQDVTEEKVSTVISKYLLYSVLWGLQPLHCSVFKIDTLVQTTGTR